MKISGTNTVSKCLYCGSPNYGKGCPYGPDGLHVHTDDPRSCVWCGSKNQGNGCPFNPFGKMHQRGYQYNPVIIESVKQGIVRGVLMKHLNTPVTETPAFKTGLINENYDRLRQPENIVEATMLSPTDIFIHRLVKVLGSRKELINSAQIFESNIPSYQESADEVAERYRNELDYKDAIRDIINSLTESTKTACSNGLAPESAEKIIAEMIAGIE